MNISVNNNTNLIRNSYTSTPQAAPAEAKSSSDTMVERIVDKTYLSANYAASGLAGAASGTGAWVTTGIPTAIKTTGSAVVNILKTEKYGPVLKGVAATGALVAGVAGGAIAAPVALFSGIWQGAGEVDRSVPRQFTVSQASQEAYSEVRDGLKDFGKGIQEDMQRLGDYKLSPGERPIEIPLIRAAKTLVMGSVAAVVGGAIGIASAAAATVSEAGKGIVEAFTDERLNVAEKVFSSATSVVGAAAHGVGFGLASGLSTFGQGVGQTWDKGVVAGAKSIFSEAGNSLATAVAPRTTLLEEKPESAA